MRFRKSFALLPFLLLAPVVFSQTTPRRAGAGTPPRTATATPAPTPSTARVASPQVTPLPLTQQLAVVNGQNVTLGDLDPSVSAELQQLPQKIAEARRQVLEMQINTKLLDIEANKRRMTSQQLYDIEVTKKITDPTAAEIQQFFDANRDQLGGQELDKIKPDLVVLIRGKKEEQLSDALVSRLRAGNPVVAGVDINSPNPTASAVFATVGGQPLVAGPIVERLKPVIYRLQQEHYQVEREALDRTIDDVLLIAEANKRSIGPEVIVRTEITEKLHHPTEAEITKFYNDNKANITGELPVVHDQIATYLEQQEQGNLERALSDRLRKGATVKILLTEPEPPVQIINTNGEPARGDATAPVTIVEFTDFQCPACAAMQPILEGVLKSYGNKVRFVVRNFPLQKHPDARKAAEAADAANAQGKFFEYTALLFKRQDKLDVPSLKKYATEIGLDRVRFDAELDNGTHAAEVKHDIDEGQIYGVNVTPTIFINGIMLEDLSADGLRVAIDKAIGRALAR